MQSKLLSQQQLLEHIKAAADHKSPFIIAIDGYAGAGKSTLAKFLASQLAAPVITLDDFYGALTPAQQDYLQGEQAVQAYFDALDFADKVLIPLQNNMPVSWRPIDWLTGRSLALKQLVPEGVVIIEGVFACAVGLLKHVDMSIMVTADQAVCQQRVLARPQEDAAWYRHWAATENWYHRANRTQHRVRYLYSGTG